ncbi:glycosyltransferase [Trujillonella humicola]|uniref:glycosyltransferase n=1 Tax=Trujillonella humicola TaxID=3383699 RepID=UPI003905DF80
MRIALVTAGCAPPGLERTLALAGALARAGTRVTVWSPARGGSLPPTDPAVRVRFVPVPDLPGEDRAAHERRTVTALGTAFAASGEEYDVVHARDASGARAVPACVRTVHHLDTAEPPAPPVAAPRALLCGSATVATEVRARWGREASVVPDGVDVDRFAAAAGPGGAAGRGRWRARLGRFVLAVGGIEPRGGVLELVEAMATVQLVRSELLLVLAGEATRCADPRHRALLDARAQEREVYPLVLGPVPDDEHAALVAAADVLVLSSTRQAAVAEGLEALAAGVPVVARDLPAVREVLGDAAAPAASTSALAAGVLAATAPDPRRAAAGRALAARHGWEAAARAHLRCYEALVAEGVRQPVRA